MLDGAGTTPVDILSKRAAVAGAVSVQLNKQALNIESDVSSDLSADQQVIAVSEVASQPGRGDQTIVVEGLAEVVSELQAKFLDEERFPPSLYQIMRGLIEDVLKPSAPPKVDTLA